MILFFEVFKSMSKFRFVGEVGEYFVIYAMVLFADYNINYNASFLILLFIIGLFIVIKIL